MKTSDNPTLDDLHKEFRSTTETQIRVDKKGEIYAKMESDRSGGIFARISGQDGKFKAAEAMVTQAFTRTTGQQPDAETQQMISDGVRGVGNQPLSQLITNLQEKASQAIVNAAATPEQAVTNLSARLSQPLIENQIGSTVFQAVENSQFSIEQKQNIHNSLVQGIIQKECANVVGGNTLLRGNNAGTNYMTAFMDTYAAEYNQAILNDTNQLLAGVEILNTASNKEAVPNPGENTIKGVPMTQEQHEAWDEAYTRMGTGLVQSMQDNRNLLTPEANQFLQTIHQTALETTPANDQKEIAARTAIISTLALRGAMPTIAKDVAQGNQLDPNRAVGQFMIKSSVVNQSYFNLLDSSNLTQEGRLPPGKPQNIIVNNMRTPESMDQIKNFVRDIGGANNHQHQNAVQAPAVANVRQGMIPNARSGRVQQADAVQVQAQIHGGENDHAKVEVELNNKDAGELIPKGNLQDRMQAYMAKVEGVQPEKKQEAKEQGNKVKAGVGWKSGNPSLKEEGGGPKIR